MSTLLGTTFACRDGFTAQFDLAQSDEEIVIDEVYHRMTTDSVLGDTPEAIDWGLNVFRRCGGTFTDAEVSALGPEYSAMLQQSPLVETADVTVTRTATAALNLAFAITVTPKNPETNAIGDPLSFVFLLTPDTFLRVGDPDLTAGT